MFNLDEVKLLEYDSSKTLNGNPKTNMVPMWAIDILLEQSSDSVRTNCDVVDMRAPFSADGIHVQSICTKTSNDIDSKKARSPRYIIYIWHDDGRRIYYYDSDDDLIMSANILNTTLFSRVQSCLIRELYGIKLNRVLYDSTDELLRYTRWVQLPTVYSILHDDDIELTRFSYDEKKNDTVELDWYVVEGIMSLGTYSREFPLSKSDLLFADLSFDVVSYQFGRLMIHKCVIILDGENPVVAIYHNALTMESNMMCFNEEKFWVLYEQLTANFQ